MNTLQLPTLLSQNALKWCGRWMTLLLLLKLAGYFTVSESIAVTQVVKVFLRLTASVGTGLILIFLLRTGHVFSLKLRHWVPLLFYAAYLLLGFISLLWSTDPGYSALQWAMDAESLLFAYLFMRVYALLKVWYPEGNISFGLWMARAIFPIALIFVAGMYLAPDQFFRMTHEGSVARLGGNLMNPNELGMLCVVGAALTFPQIKHSRRRLQWVLMAALMVFAVLATGSRSSLIGFFLVGLWYVWTKGTALQKSLSIVGMVLAVPLAVNMIFIKAGDVGEVLSMTGRLPFWKALLTEGLPESPLFGFGFMRIAWTDTFQSVNTYAGHMTHNTFIQVFMNLGFVGGTLALFSLFSLLRLRRKMRKHADAFAFTAILLPVFINSLTEFGIFGETNFDILIYQMLLFLFSFKFNPLLSTKESIKLKKAIQAQTHHNPHPSHNGTSVPQWGTSNATGS